MVTAEIDANISGSIETGTIVQILWLHDETRGMPAALCCKRHAAAQLPSQMEVSGEAFRKPSNEPTFGASKPFLLRGHLRNVVAAVSYTSNTDSLKAAWLACTVADAVLG
jgi:hypothetical protein